MKISHTSLSFYVNNQCYTVWYATPWKYFRFLVPKINLQLIKNLDSSAFPTVY